MSLKQITEGYGYGIIQNCFGLLQVLKKEGISHNDFLKFVEESKKKDNDFVKKQPRKEPLPKEQPKRNMFLKPGETVSLPGVVCDKCHGEVYIEGLCRNNPLAKQGFVRRGICGNCNAEFGIR